MTPEEREHERTEAHAFLTGKFEIGFVMTHPDGEPHTELGKAAKRLLADRDALRESYMQTSNAVEQSLGKALGYSWYKDDPSNFPNATESDGVCTGEHTAESIAAEAATAIVTLREAAQLAREALNKVVDDLSETPFRVPENSDPCLCNEHGLCYPHAALFEKLLRNTLAALDAALGEVKDETIHLSLEE